MKKELEDNVPINKRKINHIKREKRKKTHPQEAAHSLSR